MEMKKKKITIDQLNIFDLIKEVSKKQSAASAPVETAGKASIDAAIRSIISESLKQSPMSRYEIAGQMSDILGVEISKSQLDAWSAESKENHRFPLVYSGAFCRATQDNSLARYMADMCGGYFIQGEDAIRLELGKIEEQKQRLSRKEKVIREFLGEVHHGR